MSKPAFANYNDAFDFGTNLDGFRPFHLTKALYSPGTSPNGSLYYWIHELVGDEHTDVNAIYSLLQSIETWTYDTALTAWVRFRARPLDDDTTVQFGFPNGSVPDGNSGAGAPISPDFDSAYTIGVFGGLGKNFCITDISHGGRLMFALDSVSNLNVVPPSGFAEIAASVVSNPGQVVTSHLHGLVDGQLVTIFSHSGSTPNINGSYNISVIDANTFALPGVNITVGGTGGGVYYQGDDLHAGGSVELAEGMDLIVDARGATGISIAEITASNPAHIITAQPHFLENGATVNLSGIHSTTPAISGPYIATVINDHEISIPLNVTVGVLNEGTLAYDSPRWIRFRSE